MQTWEIEVRRTSYVTVWVEADTQDEATDKAWDEINSGYYTEDASWDIHSINGNEVTEAK
jgi:hypothetical protein